MTKFVLGILLSVSMLATASDATKDSTEIERKVGVLGRIAFGVDKQTVKARNAEEMIIKLAMKNRGESRAEIMENFHRNLKSKDIVFGDMVGWGTMGVEAAIDLYS